MGHGEAVAAHPVAGGPGAFPFPGVEQPVEPGDQVWRLSVGDELLDERVAARIAGRFFPPEDARWVSSAASPDGRSARFAQLWCRREACVKVYGGRLVEGLALPVAGAGPVPLPAAGVSASVRDVPLPDGFPGFRAAVAVQGARPFRVHRRVWSGTAATAPC